MMSIIVRYSNGSQDQKWLLNQCFAKVALNLDKYDINQPFKSWMSRVMVNEILDHKRKEKRREVAESKYSRDKNHTITFNSGERDLQLNDLLSLLDKLPPQTKMVFNMYAIDGFKHREIAQKLKISVGTSKWHLAQARKQLQELIQAVEELPEEFNPNPALENGYKTKLFNKQ